MMAREDERGAGPPGAAREEYAPGCFRERADPPRRAVLAAAAPARSRRAVLAAYRPQSNDIALFLDDGDRSAAVAVTVAEARAIHGALGTALRLADCRDDPLKAVEINGET